MTSDDIDKILWISGGSAITGLIGFIFALSRDVLKERRAEKKDKAENEIVSQFPEVQQDLIRLIIKRLLKIGSFNSLPEHINEYVSDLIVYIEKGLSDKSIEVIKKLQNWTQYQNTRDRNSPDFRDLVRLTLIASESLNTNSIIKSMINGLDETGEFNEAYFAYKKAALSTTKSIKIKNDLYQECLDIIEKEKENSLKIIGTELNLNLEVINEIQFLEELKIIVIYERFYFFLGLFQGGTHTELKDNPSILHSQIHNLFGILSLLESIQNILVFQGETDSLKRYFNLFNKMKNDSETLGLWSFSTFLKKDNLQLNEGLINIALKSSKKAVQLKIPRVHFYLVFVIECHRWLSTKEIENSNFSGAIRIMDNTSQFIIQSVSINTSVTEIILTDVYSYYHSIAKLAPNKFESEKTLKKALNLLETLEVLFQNRNPDLLQKASYTFKYDKGRMLFTLFTINGNVELIEQFLICFNELLQVHEEQPELKFKRFQWSEFYTIFGYACHWIKAHDESIQLLKIAYSLNKEEVAKFLRKNNAGFLLDHLDDKNSSDS